MVTMLAVELVDRILEKSDLRNANVDFNDVVYSINDAYLLCYTELLNCLDDFTMAKEVVVENAKTRIEFEEDFMRVFAVEYMLNGKWREVKRISRFERTLLQSGNYISGYFIEGDGVSFYPQDTLPATVRITYAPVPEKITIDSNISAYNYSIFAFIQYYCAEELCRKRREYDRATALSPIVKERFNDFLRNIKRDSFTLSKISQTENNGWSGW